MIWRAMDEYDGVRCEKMPHCRGAHVHANPYHMSQLMVDGEKGGHFDVGGVCVRVSSLWGRG